MRQIGTCETRPLAERFFAYLHVRGVDSELREAAAGRWSVWVLDEDAMRTSQEAFQAFCTQPQAVQFDAPTPAPATSVAAPTPWRMSAGETNADVVGASFPAATWALIVLSVGFTLLAPLGSDQELARLLRMSPSALRQGELWRLITPVFQHLAVTAGGMGFLHLLFNMMWLRDFGVKIETKRGTAGFLMLFAVIAVASNFAEFLVTGSGFGGMSGVVYGLFGYVWVKVRRDPWSGYTLDPSTIWVLVAWFLLGATGLFGPVANWAHGGGLLTGALCAFVPSWWQTRKKRA
ncbi:MAG: rhomboid family intramembrane serine protease [bacterium]